MAGSYVGTDSPLRETLWRPGLIHEAERQAITMGFMSKDDDSGIVEIDDFSRKRGDKIQVRFSPTDDTFDGFGERDPIEGNEMRPDVLFDEFVINYLGFAFAEDSPMTQQRVSWDLKAAAFTKLGAIWGRRFEQWNLNQLAGYTPNNSIAGYKRSGHNAVQTYDEDHVCRPDAEDKDEDLTTGDEITLSLIDDALLKATSRAYTDWPLLPLSDGYFHLIVHTSQWRDLRRNTTSGEWADIHRAVIEGGKPLEESAFVKSWLGVWNRTKIHVSDYVPHGVRTDDATTAVTTVRRAVLIAQRAMHFGFGQGYTDGNHLDWVEQTRNYKTWGVLADTIGGCKRTVFKDPTGTYQTYGAMVLPTHTGV